MRFGSICSGIEAASVAWDRLGWEAAWLAEVDVSASRVLAHRLGATAPVHPLPKTGKAIARLEWGDRITNWGDMTRLPDLVRSGVAEAPDILCGGTPCQAFSVAGRREGLADDRGQLTLAFVDLADAIDLKRAERGESPCVVFWENVPGVLSSKDNAFGCLLAALAGEDDPLVPAGKRWSDAGLVVGPERTVAWRVQDAQYFGLAQRRRRVFVIASSRAGFDPGEVQFEFDGLRRDSAPSRAPGQGAAAPAGAGASESRGAGRSDDPDGSGPRTGRHHRLTPQGYRLVAFGEYADDDTASTMQARDCKDVTDLIVTPPAARAVALRGREGGGSIEMGDDVANALRASSGGSDKEHVLAPIPLVEIGCRTGARATRQRERERTRRGRGRSRPAGDDGHRPDHDRAAPHAGRVRAAARLPRKMDLRAGRRQDGGGRTPLQAARQLVGGLLRPLVRRPNRRPSRRHRASRDRGERDG